MNILKFLISVILLINFFSSDLKAKNLGTEITKNLRCLICQGQSVYDSDSEFAISVKILVKQKLDEGLSCLLYTSPSPRDPIGSRMPSSA